MDYDEVISDIAIAQKALAKSLLLSTVEEKQLICEVFCVPAHNHQTFYLQVYKDGQAWVLLFAKPLIDARIAMRRFKAAVRADGHAAHKGDIYCGLKRLPASDPRMAALLAHLPVKEERTEEKGITLDGVTTYIKNHSCHPAAELLFYRGEMICKNNYSEEQKVFLEDLYMFVEKIIGNLYRANQGPKWF